MKFSEELKQKMMKYDMDSQPEMESAIKKIWDMYEERGEDSKKDGYEIMDKLRLDRKFAERQARAELGETPYKHLPVDKIMNVEDLPSLEEIKADYPTMKAPRLIQQDLVTKPAYSDVLRASDYNKSEKERKLADIAALLGLDK